MKQGEDGERPNRRKARNSRGFQTNWSQVLLFLTISKSQASSKSHLKETALSS